MRNIRQIPLAGKRKRSKWKENLCREKYSPTTINSMLAVVNKLLVFLGFPECRCYNEVKQKAPKG